MSFLLTLISPSPYPGFPQGLASWVFWVALFGVLVLLSWKARHANKPLDRRNLLLFLLLLLSVPASALFLGVRLPAGSALPPPDMPLDQPGSALMVFIAVPWVLAAGLLGPAFSVFLALFSGLLLGSWETHSLFTPLEFGLLAVLLSMAFNQRYRTRLYRLLRHPLPAGLLLSVFYPLLFLASAIFSTRGILVSRLDYALTHMLGASLAMAVELVIAGLIAEVIVMALPRAWGQKGVRLPSPSEKSLETRFLSRMAPLVVFLTLSLMIGDWVVAGNAASRMLQARMANAAELAAQSVPYFLIAGQNLISQLATDPLVYNTNEKNLPDLLMRDLRTVPFFHQLVLLDENGELLASYPSRDYNPQQAPLDEQMGVQLALNGIPIQSYTIPPDEGGTSAQVSFMAEVKDEQGSIRGVLIGRSDLNSNTFTQPLLLGLNNLAGVDGEGMLLDENNRILYAKDPALLMSPYTVRQSDQPLFFKDTAPDGTRRLVYVQRAEGRPWAIVLAVPAHRAQQLALEIAAPLLGMIILLVSVAAIILKISLHSVTASLQSLSLEAGRISQGELDHPLVVEGEDEVGQLRGSFEQMRASLKARLDELNRLLLVSQGVASNLEMREAVRPVLDAALSNGASAARVVLSPAVVPDWDGSGPARPVSFGIGPAGEAYASLDEQILALTRQQERLVVTSPTRSRSLKFPPGKKPPEALLAVALKNESQYYGALWILYEEPHPFLDEEVRFMITLAGQAALAAANANLFLNAEIGRQRLAAILASTPDPVLVTDQQDRLLLSNPAAWQALGLGIETAEGQPIEALVEQKELANLLRSSSAETQSAEVCLADGRVYLATASPVVAEGQRMGRVCVLRDITHFKELDALKSEFVATVSHDLRSPLTLMRGYATMMEMVGDLNEQQTGYVRKIVTGVESMSHLVSNLLDLGRIEAGIGLKVETTPILDIVERVVSALQLQANQKRIQLTLETPPNTVPLIEADPALLQQALQNLVENAIKYTKAEGRVKVRMHARQERMIFEVSDTGIGVAPMDQPRLFEKFYRGAQQGSKDQRGTGLGLAIVKSIAERHGGQVWMESQLGKGSTFYLAIPLKQPRPEAGESA